MLVAEYGDASKPFIVLTGHMDTVFGDGTAAARPFTIKDGKVTGPGVLDMKGGVTILLYAVRFLLEAGYNRYRIKIILAGDEEVAHGNSTASADYEKEAKGAVMGFNLETGCVDNSVVIERKGVAQYLFEVDGVGAHAGNNPEDGRSAVEELAHKILDIQAETDWQEGTTVNCGVIAGQQPEWNALRKLSRRLPRSSTSNRQRPAARSSSYSRRWKDWRVLRNCLKERKPLRKNMDSRKQRQLLSAAAPIPLT